MGCVSNEVFDTLSAVMDPDSLKLEIPVADESSLCAVSKELPEALHAMAGGSHTETESALLDEALLRP